MNIHIIWAQDNNGGIGKGNRLPWHISEDLINFKKITNTHTIIMGRRTWDSLPKKPLPNRRNIVLSSKKIDDVECYKSVDLCLKKINDDKINDVFIIGGKMIYSSFFNLANILHITFINETVNGVDTYFPIPIKRIKENYKIVSEVELGLNCVYTKWTKAL
tara:strand:+ start:1021 stop:1503 length:483 start_codon:yes stop_codon:yes gene_type:complete